MFEVIITSHFCRICFFPYDIALECLEFEYTEAGKAEAKISYDPTDVKYEERGWSQADGAGHPTLHSQWTRPATQEPNSPNWSLPSHPNTGPKAPILKVS